MSLQENLLFEIQNGVVVVNTVFVTPEVPVMQPITLAADGITMTVNWLPVSGVTRYIVNFTPNINGFSSQSFDPTTTSASFSGTVGLSYIFTVTAVNGNVYSISSSSNITILAAPTINPTTVSSTDGRTMTVSWNTVSRASGYIVKYGSTITPIITGTSTTIYGEPGTTYSFTVQAINSSIYSLASASSQITLLAAPTINPTTVSSTDGRTMTVSWSTVSGATGYIVKYGSTTTPTITGTSTTIYGEPGTTYSFTVQAINSSIYSLASASSQITLLAAPTINPTTVSSTDGRTMTVSWSTVSGATGYIVKYGSTTTPTITGTSTTIYGEPGTTYSFTVKSINGSIYSPASASSQIILLAAPTITSISVSSSDFTTMTVSWNTVSEATGYIVNYTPNINNVSSITLGIVNSQTFTGIPGITYSFTLQTIKNGIYSPPSAQSQIILLSQPTITSITSDGVTMTVNWNAVSGANQYIIRYNPAISGYSSITTTLESGATSASFSGGIKGTTYSFTVQANYGSIYSPISSPVTQFLSSYGITWKSVSDTYNNLYFIAVAMSSDGMYQTASISYDQTYGIIYSTNYGVNWNKSDITPINTINKIFYSIAISANGAYQTAVCNYNTTVGIIYSRDYGKSWNNCDTNVNTINKNWNSVAMSSDGKYQTAVRSVIYGSTGDPTNTNSFGIVYSTNYGVTWNYTNNSINVSSSGKSWLQVAVTSDGKNQTVISSIVVQKQGNPDSTYGIIYSTDYGVNWNYSNTNIDLVNKFISRLAMSSDGKYQTIGFALDSGFGIIYSTDYGVNWTNSDTTIFVNKHINSIAMSADGSIQLLAPGSGNGDNIGLYRSTNYGKTWVPVDATNYNTINKSLRWIAMSADGSRATVVGSSGLLTSM